MKKMNNRGFMLVETLVVSLFVMGIFTFFYRNIVPLIGQYERIQNYEDIDAKYAAHNLRMLLLSDGKNISTHFNKQIKCDTTFFKDNNAVKKCQQLSEHYGIQSMYISKYATTNAAGESGTDFKTWTKNEYDRKTGNVSRGVFEYVQGMQTYMDGTKKDFKRVIVEIKKPFGDDERYYANIEVS